MSTIIQEIDTHFTDAVTTFYAAASAGITNYVMNIAWVVSYWLARVVVFLWSVKEQGQSQDG